jgi:hypothetical protein
MNDPKVPSTTDSASAARPQVRVRGVLASERVSRGTASEHQAWVLNSPSRGQVWLKRLEVNPFELGTAPADLGSEVEAEGYLLGNELRYTSLRQL